MAGCSPAAPSKEDAAAAAVNDWLGAEPDSRGPDRRDRRHRILVCGAGTSRPVRRARPRGGRESSCLEKYAIGGGVRINLGSLNGRLRKRRPAAKSTNRICNDLMRYANDYSAPLPHLGSELWRGHRLVPGSPGGRLRAVLRGERCQAVHVQALGHGPHPQLAGFDASSRASGRHERQDRVGDYAKKVGVDFRFTTPLGELVHENGKVTGAIAKGSSNIKINAAREHRRHAQAATLA